MGIKEVLAANESKDLLRFLTAGSVDDGKSTLIGRLLYDSKLVYEDHLQTLAKDSKKVGSAGEEIDYSLLLDGLKAEREQGITIDVAYRYFSTPKRKFIIADCPGHVQYTRNMATGASTANLAIILVDAKHGMLDQTRRHSFIASLLGISHVVVAVNKMDLVDYSQEVYDKIRDEYTSFAAKLQVKHIHFIPISALKGDNVVERGDNLDWYKGASLLDYLENVHIGSDRNLIDMRFPVQYVLRQDASFRGYCGTVASGAIRKGDEVVALPSGKKTKVARIATFDGDVEEAFPPMAVAVALEDELDISRGDMLVHPRNMPRLEQEFEAILVWLNETAMTRERPYYIKHGTTSAQAEVASMQYRFDINTLSRQPAETLELNEIGRAHMVTSKPLAIDGYTGNRATGNFILIDPVSNSTVAAGMILDRRTRDDADLPAKGTGARSPHLQSHKSSVSPAQRAERIGQTPATVWLTGLPNAGKTTTAYELEQQLFGAGLSAHVLDGENLRLGISDNLGFAALERSENIRRAAHVARLCNDLGMITIVALVSPFAADRAAARDIVGADRFFEVHVSAPVEVCEQRDESGLYARARKGDIDHFTGVSAPYEAPESPELELPTHEIAVGDAVERIIAMLRDRGIVK